MKHIDIYRLTNQVLSARQYEPINIEDFMSRPMTEGGLGLDKKHINPASKQMVRLCLFDSGYGSFTMRFGGKLKKLWGYDPNSPHLVVDNFENS